MILRRKRASTVAASAVTLITAGLIAAGCGSSDESAPPAEPASGSGSGQAEDPKAKGAGKRQIPGPLADNRAEANEIVEGGTAELNDRLAALEGYPVVVNQWGSWCPPCRAELPWFADSADAHAADVAFLGIDMSDDLGAATQFLEELPIPFPSVFDPDAAATISLGGGQGSPTTFFVDEGGEVVHVRTGAYAGPEELEADIERYAAPGA